MQCLFFGPSVVQLVVGCSVWSDCTHPCLFTVFYFDLHVCFCLWCFTDWVREPLYEPNNHFVLHTFLRRWVWCRLFFVWFCGCSFERMVPCFVLFVVLLLCLEDPVQHCDHPVGKEGLTALPFFGMWLLYCLSWFVYQLQQEEEQTNHDTLHKPQTKEKLSNQLLLPERGDHNRQDLLSIPLRQEHKTRLLQKLAYSNI